MSISKMRIITETLILSLFLIAQLPLAADENHVVPDDGSKNADDLSSLQLGNTPSTALILNSAGTTGFTNANSLARAFSGGASAVNSRTVPIGDEAERLLFAPAGGNGTLTNTGLVTNVQPPVAAGEIQVAWSGGTGSWTDPTQWSTDVVPNNNDSNTYLVTINSGQGDVVNLTTQNIYLDGITVGSQSTVNVNDQGLQLGTPISTAQMLNNTGTMNFTNAGSLTFDFSGGASAVNSGTISVGDEAAIYLSAPTGGNGTLTNTGLIALENNPHGSQIYLSGDAATFALSGGGTLTLSDNVANLVTGTFGTESLVSDNKISGAGTIANLTNLTNNGSITANGLNALVINLDYSVGGSNLTGSLTNNGSITVADGSPLVLKGTNANFSLLNDGTISLNGQKNSTQLIYDDGNNHHGLFLSGSGTLTLSDSELNLIEGANGDETLYNQAQHTIMGAGVITGFGGGVTNNGMIVASGSNPLSISVTDAVMRGNPGITNNGLIQVNDGATLSIVANQSAMIMNSGSITLNAAASTSSLTFSDQGAPATGLGNFLELTGGTLTLTDSPGNQIRGVLGTEGLQIDFGATLSGAGTIGNFGGYEGLTNLGTVVASGHNPLILDGTAAAAAGYSALSNFGVLQVADGGNFEFQSAQGMSIHNWSGFSVGGGSITLNAAASNSTLSFNSMGNLATFDFGGGPGAITMTDNPGNRIVGVSGNETLSIGSQQTISGSGTIGNFFQIFNAGMIVAQGTNPLVLSVSSVTAGGLVNNGRMEVGAGTLEIVQSWLAGVNVINNGLILLDGAKGPSTLAINDLGINRAFVQSGGNPAEPFNAFSLSGSGGFLLADTPGNRIVGVNGDEAFENYGVIGAAGTISNFGASVGNAGILNAYGSNPLIIDITAAASFGISGLVNSGQITVSSGSNFEIQSTVGGTVLTSGSGQIILGPVTTGNATLSFNDEGKARTFTLANSLAFGIPVPDVVMNFAGDRIVGVSGDETLINGANSAIFGQGVISNFKQFVNNGILETIAGPGVLEVQAPLGNWNGATGTLTGGAYFADIGTLQLDSLGSQAITNLTGATVQIQNGGILTGNGAANALSGLATLTKSELDLLKNSPLTIAPAGGTLALTTSALLTDGGLSISGGLSLNATSILEVLLATAGGISVNGNLSQDATSNIVIGNSASLSASDFLNSGSIVLNAASTATFKGLASNSGEVIVTAGAQLNVVKSPFRAFGTNVYTQTAGATKVLTGGVLNAATVDLEGGTLGGGGTINANVVLDGGTLAPGDPTTTHIDGDLAVNAAGQIVLDIDGAGAGLSDSLDIVGNLHLNGGTLDIVFENGFLPQNGDSWDLLTFTGTEDGMGFGHIAFENAGNEQLDAFFNGQGFELEAGPVQATPEPSTLPLLLSFLSVFTLYRMRPRLRKGARR